jgi:hypothetical protein
MSLTFIDTNKLPKQASAGHGDVVEVLNNALCGAKNVHGSVRWLKAGDGKGRIRLDNRDYDVEKGAGVYLGPAETATISAPAGASLKLFHLIVPQIPK